MINEIESDPNPDWIEFYNAGSSTVTLTGWTVLDSQDTGAPRPYTFPSGTTIAPGAYFVITTLGFGLGDADSVRLFNASAQLVDTYAWSGGHAAGTYARCPNGTGAFADRPTATQGAANNCP